MRGHTPFKRGDRVTNGHATFTVLATHGTWVWVNPVSGLNDGPLTFRADALSHREPRAAA